MVQIWKEVTATDKELELVKLVANDLTAEEIAKILGISKRTVEDRKNRIRDRWGCKSFIGVLVMFMRNNLIQ